MTTNPPLDARPDPQQVRALIEPIRERLKAVTPGPWRAMRAGNCQCEDGRLYGISRFDGLPRPWNPVWVGWQEAKNYFKTFLKDADADFIAAAPNDIARLIEQVEALLASSAPEPTKEQTWVIDNIYTIARRESRRTSEGKAARPEMWAHVLRLCERVGAQSRTVGVLRSEDAPPLPSEGGDGSLDRRPMDRRDSPATR